MLLNNILIIPILILFNSVTAENNEALNQTNSGCYTCGISPAYTDIASACSRFSGWSQDCCQCIAYRESGGNYRACSTNGDGTENVGLWQINSDNWISCNGGVPPCELGSNLNCAIRVFNWEKMTWKSWSACRACGCCERR